MEFSTLRIFSNNRLHRKLRPLIASPLILSLILLTVGQPSAVLAGTSFYLPEPSQRLPMTEAFQPALVQGITIHPTDPLRFDFMIDPMQAKAPVELNSEIQKSINYFFASLTVPKTDLWVNLSPYEQNHVIPEALSGTEMGRDLLAQDYLLKQLTASLMDPETMLGKKFWHEVYEKAYERFGTTSMAVNTFNKVWIVPSRAVVYQNGPSAFVVDSHLKVLLEEDYLALTRHINGAGPNSKNLQNRASTVSHLVSGIVKEMILPEIEREVNTGRYFASLRQIYHALILAKWYKETFTDTPLSRAYVDQNKIQGIDLKDKQIKEKIYRRYLHAYQKGLYNFIREDYDDSAKESITRKYFAGGITLDAIPMVVKTDAAMLGPMVPMGGPDPGTRLVTVVARPIDDGLQRIKDRLYPQGTMGPVVIKMDHGDNQNMFTLDVPADTFGHAERSPGTKGIQNIYLSVPDGDKVAHMLVSGDVSIALGDIYPVQPLQAAVLNNPGLIRHIETPLLHGVGFSFTIKPSSGSASAAFGLTGIFGSGKSVRDFDRSKGNGDPMARRDIDAFVDGGKDIMIKIWKSVDANGGPGSILEAINQPRDTPKPHDEHNYILRLIFPRDITVKTDGNNNLTVTSGKLKEVSVKAELYSDHAPMKHLALEDLYTQDTLDRLIRLQDKEQAWLPVKTEPQAYVNLKKAVISLRRMELEPNHKKQQARQKAALKNIIKKNAAVLQLTEDQLQMALSPARHYADLPFLELERFSRMLYSGQYLISRNLPMLAGSPYYATVFPPDAIIVQRELIGFLRPEIVRDQFYQLLKLESNGQFPHEVDIRYSSRTPKNLEDRYRLIRADTELLILLYAATMLDHQKEYNIDWNGQIRGSETVADIVANVAGYVLGKARALKSPEEFQNLLTSKKTNDPRGSWRDGASSTFYGKYIYTLQYLMVPALKAIEKIDSERHIMPGHVLEDTGLKALIDTWMSARRQFEFTQTREERIQALMNWYGWKINGNGANPNEGLNFIMALFEDAKKYYGINYAFNTATTTTALDSIRQFLEKYMPQQPYSGRAIALDAGGNPIKVDDTDPFMFAVSSVDDVTMADIKNGLKSEFMHVVFGGTGTTSGELLTGIPAAVNEEDRYIKAPVGLPGPVDIYAAHRLNYHTIKWISMEYKKLNGLIRQINHLLDRGEGNSPDVKNLIEAVMLRFDELAGLSGEETQETLEPYADSSNGGVALSWRPFGSSDAQEENPLGIHSGAVQGFNLIVLAAVSNWEKLMARVDRIYGKSPGGDNFSQYIRSFKPAAVRRSINIWLGQRISSLNGAGPSNGHDKSVSPAMTAPGSNPGGIDLNTDLFHIKILNKNSSFSSDSTSLPPVRMDGIVPVIIGNTALPLAASRHNQAE
jgi:hypothetical protein